MKQPLLYALLAIALLLQGIEASAQRKEVAILGDSYSTFEGYLTPDSNAVWYFNHQQECTDVTRVTETWWHRLVSRHGLKLGINNSFSGATICSTGYNGEDYSNRSFWNRAKHLGQPDMILVCGGTNDSWAKSPIGSYKYADWTATDLYSFRPAMAFMLHELTEHYPNTPVYFILNDGLSTEVTQSTLAICHHYHIPCIVLEGIDKMNGHPTVKGMEQIEAQVAKVVCPAE